MHYRQKYLDRTWDNDAKDNVTSHHLATRARVSRYDNTEGHGCYTTSYNTTSYYRDSTSSEQNTRRNESYRSAVNSESSNQSVWGRIRTTLNETLRSGHLHQRGSTEFSSRKAPDRNYVSKYSNENVGGCSYWEKSERKENNREIARRRQESLTSINAKLDRKPSKRFIAVVSCESSTGSFNVDQWYARHSSRQLDPPFFKPKRRPSNDDKDHRKTEILPLKQYSPNSFLYKGHNSVENHASVLSKSAASEHPLTARSRSGRDPFGSTRNLYLKLTGKEIYSGMQMKSGRLNSQDMGTFNATYSHTEKDLSAWKTNMWETNTNKANTGVLTCSAGNNNQEKESNSQENACKTEKTAATSRPKSRLFARVYKSSGLQTPKPSKMDIVIVSDNNGQVKIDHSTINKTKSNLEEYDAASGSNSDVEYVDSDMERNWKFVKMLKNNIMYATMSIERPIEEFCTETSNFCDHPTPAKRNELLKSDHEGEPFNKADISQTGNDESGGKAESANLSHSITKYTDVLGTSVYNTMRGSNIAENKPQKPVICRGPLYERSIPGAYEIGLAQVTEENDKEIGRSSPSGESQTKSGRPSFYKAIASIHKNNSLIRTGKVCVATPTSSTLNHHEPCQNQIYCEDDITSFHKGEQFLRVAKICYTTPTSSVLLQSTADHERLKQKCKTTICRSDPSIQRPGSYVIQEVKFDEFSECQSIDEVVPVKLTPQRQTYQMLLRKIVNKSIPNDSTSNKTITNEFGNVTRTSTSKRPTNKDAKVVNETNRPPTHFKSRNAVPDGISPIAKTNACRATTSTCPTIPYDPCNTPLPQIKRPVVQRVASPIKRATPSKGNALSVKEHASNVQDRRARQIGLDSSTYCERYKSRSPSNARTNASYTVTKHTSPHGVTKSSDNVNESTTRAIPRSHVELLESVRNAPTAIRHELKSHRDLPIKSQKSPTNDFSRHGSAIVYGPHTRTLITSDSITITRSRDNDQIASETSPSRPRTSRIPCRCPPSVSKTALVEASCEGNTRDENTGEQDNCPSKGYDESIETEKYSPSPQYNDVQIQVGTCELSNSKIKVSKKEKCNEQNKPHKSSPDVAKIKRTRIAKPLQGIREHISEQLLADQAHSTISVGCGVELKVARAKYCTATESSQFKPQKYTEVFSPEKDIHYCEPVRRFNDSDLKLVLMASIRQPGLESSDECYTSDEEYREVFIDGSTVWFNDNGTWKYAFLSKDEYNQLMEMKDGGAPTPTDARDCSAETVTHGIQNKNSINERQTTYKDIRDSQNTRTASTIDVDDTEQHQSTSYDRSVRDEWSSPTQSTCDFDDPISTSGSDYENEARDQRHLEQSYLSSDLTRRQAYPQEMQYSYAQSVAGPSASQTKNTSNIERTLGMFNDDIFLFLEDLHKTPLNSSQPSRTTSRKIKPPGLFSRIFGSGSGGYKKNAPFFSNAKLKRSKAKMCVSKNVLNQSKSTKVTDTNPAVAAKKTAAPRDIKLKGSKAKISVSENNIKEPPTHASNGTVIPDNNPAEKKPATPRDIKLKGSKAKISVSKNKIKEPPTHASNHTVIPEAHASGMRTPRNKPVDGGLTPRTSRHPPQPPSDKDPRFTYTDFKLQTEV